MRVKPLKVSYINIIIFLMYFAIIKVYVFPQVIRQILKIISITLVLLYLLAKVRKELFDETFVLAVFFSLSSMIGYVNKEITFRIFLDGILNAVCIYMISICVKYCSNTGYMKKMLNQIFYLTFISCMISLVSIIVAGRAESNSGTSLEYFFGNKFSTCYLFMFLVGLASTKYYDERRNILTHKMNILLLIFLALFASYWTQCSTTLIGTLFLFATILLSNKYADKLRKLFGMPFMAVLYIIIPGIIVFNISHILSIPFIQYLIINVLKKTAGMTGRVYIYSTLLGIVAKKPIFGYGYNSNIVYHITKVGNSQNGIIEIVIGYGMVGAFIMLWIAYKSFDVSKNRKDYWGLKVFIVALCICSIVEISFNYLFFWVLFILRYSYNEDKRRDELYRNNTIYVDIIGSNKLK